MAIGDVLFKGTVTLLAGASLIAGIGVATAMVQRFAFHRQVRAHARGSVGRSRENACVKKRECKRDKGRVSTMGASAATCRV